MKLQLQKNVSRRVPKRTGATFVKINGKCQLGHI